MRAQRIFCTFHVFVRNFVPPRKKANRIPLGRIKREGVGDGGGVEDALDQRFVAGVAGGGDGDGHGELSRAYPLRTDLDCIAEVLAEVEGEDYK